MHEKVHDLCGDLGEGLERLAAEGLDKAKASKLNKKISTIVERAACLAAEVSQQPYWFRFLSPSPGEQFNPECMEDVGGGVSLGDDPGISEDDRRVSLLVFPCVFRQERDGGGNTISIVINKARVTIEAGDSCTTVEQ